MVLDIPIPQGFVQLSSLQAQQPMTDPRLANGQAAAGSSSEPQGSGPSSDPKQDPAIFRPDGFIVFPRSDGDPNYGPPNTDAPPPSAKEVNYFHVFEPSDPKFQRWSLAIGNELANWAGKPKKAPNGKPWRLLDFPKDYHFTEQRKGPNHGYRTDPYLFGEPSELNSNDAFYVAR